MNNLELKAKTSSIDHERFMANQLPCHHTEILHQTDIYYRTENGRLKLRIINKSDAQLIHYFRPNQTENKISSYQILKLPNSTDSIQFFDTLFKRWKTVEKTREVFLYKNARIHLDQVEGLGSFIEFEVIIETPFPSSFDLNLFEELKSHFKIHPAQEISYSYSDMIE